MILKLIAYIIGILGGVFAVWLIMRVLFTNIEYNKVNAQAQLLNVEKTWTITMPMEPGYYKAFIHSGSQLDLHVVEVYWKVVDLSKPFLYGRCNGHDFALSYFDGWMPNPIQFSEVPKERFGDYTVRRIVVGED